MEFKTSNIGKPRHKAWKLATRFLVLSLPAYMAIIASLPDSVPEDFKVWANVVLGFLVATVQGLSELTVDKTQIDDTTV